TGVVKGVTALLDSGATGLFIDRDFVWTQGLTTRPLTHPIPVWNVDGTMNAAGAIQEVVDLILRYRGLVLPGFGSVRFGGLFGRTENRTPVRFDPIGRTRTEPDRTSARWFEPGSNRKKIGAHKRL